MKKVLIILAIIFGGIVGLYYLMKPSDKLTARQFEFVKVDKGNVTETVTAEYPISFSLAKRAARHP